MQPDDKVNILLVDDHPENLLALESVLSDLGQNLVCAHSGREALKHLLDRDFAVVLLDVQMPEMDGFETASLIRARERSRHTPIVFLTAINKTEYHVSRGYSVGAVDYVFKPFQPEVLRAKVITFVELARKTQALQREVEQRESAEAEIRKLNSELEKRVQGRTAQLRAANKELQTEIAERQKVQDERESALAREQHARIAAEEAVRANDDLVQALRASEEQYRLLAEAIPHLVWTARPDGAFDYVNGRWSDYTGHPAESLLGGAWWESVHPEDVDRARAEYVSMLEGGQVYYTEARLRRADGVYRWHLARAIPVRDSEGRLLRWFGTCTDIDDQKRATESLELLAEASTVLSETLDYEQTLARVADLVVPRIADWCAVDILDHNGKVRRLAVAHRDPEKVALGWELWERFQPEQDSDLGVYSILRSGASELVADISEEMIRERVTDPEQLRIIAALGLRSYMGVALKARDRVFGAITFIAAESGRCFDAEDLALAEDLARRAANAIDNALLFREVEAAGRAKDEFLAMLGHELRNPLAPIRNAVASMRARGTVEPSIRRARDVIERQVGHLTRLVDDLLDVSRISSGRIELRKERIDLLEAARHAVETARPIIESREHQLSILLPEDPIWVDADETRLEQVITNLLHNSAKYSDPGARIWLSVERDGKQAIVRVKDTGVGIAPEMLARIFDPFAQAERSLDRSQGGLGLGLTLVQRLVEMHGGRVSAASAGLGKGAEFSIFLPVATGLGAASGRSQVTAPPARNGRAVESETQMPPVPIPPEPTQNDREARRVLVVDDNVDAAETLSELLDIWGYNVRCVHHGRAALDEAQQFVPELVFLDIGLPGMDGYEVARRMRELPELRDVILIAVTGYGQEDDRRRSLEARLDHHLTKPVDPDALRQLLKDMLTERASVA